MEDFNLKSTILGILKPSEIIDSSSPEYKTESQTWQAHRNLHSKVLARPDSVESLSQLVKFLAISNLDFAVRCQGIGDASARDVLISLANFDSFAFDKDSETITIGSGLTWTAVDKYMDEQAHGYQGGHLTLSYRDMCL